MAVVTKYGRGFKDPSSIFLAPATQAEGRVREIASAPVAIANGDSATSKIYLGKLPSSAILLPALCILHHSAITGLNDLDIGIELNGTVIDVDALADGLDVTSAGTKSIVAAVPITDLGKRVWEIASLGYANDPACEFDVVAVMNAAATAAGNLAAFIGFARK